MSEMHTGAQVYFRLYKQEQYDKIIENLKVYLLSSYKLLMLQEIGDAFARVEKKKLTMNTAY